MAISEATPAAAGQPVSSIVWRLAYRIVSYFAIVSVFGALLYGFRYDAAASPWNYAYNLALYAVFAIPHLVMTRAWFKRQVWGIAEGSPRERRVYILTTTVM